MLGSLQKDMNGNIEFNQFYKIMEISSKYGKNRFAEKKGAMLVERRAALARNDNKAYEKICMEMTQREQMLVQSKLTEITKKLGVSDQEFQKSATHWSQDREKGM